MIGLISDTHENEEATKKAVVLFKRKNVDFVVHCGDIVSPPMLEHLQDIKTKFIYGNNDGEREGLRLMCQKLGFEEIQDEIEFEYYGKKFYAYHGTKSKILNDAISSEKYDYILTGHIHVKRDETIRKTRVINPGALFHAYQYTVAILDAQNDKLIFYPI